MNKTDYNSISLFLVKRTLLPNNQENQHTPPLIGRNKCPLIRDCESGPLIGTSKTHPKKRDVPTKRDESLTLTIHIDQPLLEKEGKGTHQLPPNLSSNYWHIMHTRSLIPGME
jgi:hypothetical protein